MHSSNLSSAPLQILIYFNWHFSMIFFSSNLALFAYKSVKYYYASDTLTLDFCTVFLYGAAETLRLNSLTKGNKTTTSFPIFFSQLIAISLLALHAYYMSLQSYVLLIDIILNSLAMLFIGSEFILGFITALAFRYSI